MVNGRLGAPPDEGDELAPFVCLPGAEDNVLRNQMHSILQSGGL
jgi:hypothetical protein